MRRSKIEIYLHLVWATRGREPRLSGQVERAVRHCVEEAAGKLGCQVLALGGMPDHVHLLVKVPSNVSAAALAKQAKGASSRLVNVRIDPESSFGWQEGYGAFSVTGTHVERVKAYVLNQKIHHAEGQTWAEWEETDEPPIDD